MATRKVGASPASNQFGMFDGEEWRPVVGYEDLYEVSSHGRVRSLDRRTLGADGNAYSFRGKMLPGTIDGGGYRRYSLTRNNVSEAVYGHDLVLAAFIGPKPDGMVVNHLDHDGINNCLSNLEYTTYAANFIHAHRKRRRDGTLKRRKIGPSDVREIRRRVAGGESATDLAVEYGVSQPMVSMIISRKRWGWVT